MRRGFIVGSLAVATATALAACLIDTSGLSGGVAPTPSSDGGSEAASPISTATIPDAGDAGVDACVPALSTRDAGDIVPLVGFSLVGGAVVDGTSVLLTADKGSQAGAIWSTDTAFFDHVDVTAGFEISTATPPAADGIAFAWVNETTLPGIGGGGSGLGVDGLPGFAVIIDEYGQNYPVSAPLVAVVDLKKSASSLWLMTAQTIQTPIIDGAEHFFHVRLESGAVSVYIDDELVLDGFAITGYGAYAGRWGFGAGTGQNTASHRITRVSFVDPSVSCGD